MKSTIITILLAVVAMAGQAKDIIWENPSAFMGNYNGMFFINQVELKPTETVLHITANYLPHNWIRFDKHSYLQTPDGKKYGITNGLKTNEQESDLTPDSLFWMPESGTANLALHFKPVPMDTKKMDFLESEAEQDFKFWNICDGKTKEMKMLGYKPGMNLDFYVGGFRPLGTTESFNNFFRFADDGTVKIEVPLWLTREVSISVSGMGFSNIIIAPGQETEILMKVTSDHQPFVAFKGYMAKTNMDLVNAHNTFEPYADDEKTYLKVKDCLTKEERLQCLTDIFNKNIAAIQKTKFTTATKDLLCMAAEERFVSWTRDFEFQFSPYYMDENGKVCMSDEDLEKKIKYNCYLLMLTDDERDYTWKYLNEPGSPCSNAFWSTTVGYYDKKAHEKNNYNMILNAIPQTLSNESIGEDQINSITFEDCKAVIFEYRAEQKRIAEKLTNLQSVYYQKLDNVAPENILQTILDKYKGKAVLIDIWATWCGPCKAGHKAMAPWKQELKGKDIQFVYITSSTSPLSTWQGMIKDIDGDHYYLTMDQYNYILEKFESEGIPTYAIYDAQGNQTFKAIGFSRLEPFKAAVEKVLK